MFLKWNRTRYLKKSEFNRVPLRLKLKSNVPTARTIINFITFQLKVESWEVETISQLIKCLIAIFYGLLGFFSSFNWFGMDIFHDIMFHLDGCETFDGKPLMWFDNWIMLIFIRRLIVLFFWRRGKRKYLPVLFWLDILKVSLVHEHFWFQFFYA